MRTAFIVASCWTLFACDQVGPGVEGMVSAAPDASVGSELQVNLCPASQFQGAACRFDGSRTMAVSDGGLPMAYRAYKDIGNSTERRWQVVIWSPRDVADGGTDGGAGPRSSAVAPGDWYGTRSFQLSDCGGGVFCNVTRGVDVVIDQQAP